MESNEQFDGTFYYANRFPLENVDTKEKLTHTIHKNYRPVGLNNIGNTCYFNSLLQVKKKHKESAIVPSYSFFLFLKKKVLLYYCAF